MEELTKNTGKTVIRRMSLRRLLWEKERAGAQVSRYVRRWDLCSGNSKKSRCRNARVGRGEESIGVREMLHKGKSERFDLCCWKA